MREDRTAFETEWSPRPGDAGPPPDLKISEANAQDVNGCVALAAQVADGTGDDWSALFGRDIVRDDRYLAVARTGVEVIAYGRTAWFEPDDDAPANAAPAGYYLIGLVVDPNWRRRGIARAITRARLAWVAERAAEAWYFADRDNAVSMRLHDQAGFARVTDDFWFPTVTDGCGSHVLGRVQLPPR
jgi:ribosomal protein S18 acetylase RimI-like enzyme